MLQSVWIQDHTQQDSWLESAGSRLAEAEPACACDRSGLSFKQQQ